ncbi:MAG: diguanylate cyclase [Desulfatitalea sp.]|nr:diguanylate cyclase [Desulfatitalea sp.]MBI5894731.1 diguanylate cyclase [Desulfobacterales bacterium]
MDKNFPILVVDDDIVSRSVVQKYLLKAGFEVLCAGNGKEAMAKFSQQFCPIVLTDWMMPEITGPQLCRMIRETKTDGYVFIILITSRDSKTDIVSGLEAGADDYLTKPIHQAELIARINTGIRILTLEQSLKSANDEIRVLSITDPLTGCFNRLYLGEQFPQEFTRSQRYKHPLAVMLVDLDHFKKVNDTYGHQAGDLVLKSIAKCILGQIREKVDWTVRYGGEEFLIILPETDCAGARTMAERVRRAVSNLTIQSADTQIQITASFGGACVSFRQKDGPVITMEDLIKKADEQLYRSKREGRDRVNVTELDPLP